MAAKGEPTLWFMPNDDRQIINLEHVLPVNPDHTWTNFNRETIDLYVKRLGNLALLPAKANSDLRSASFKEKKEVYQAAPYELTRQISTVTDWTVERIVERQRILAGLALQAWPI
jgi:Protein of unknown function (DUF1524)